MKPGIPVAVLLPDGSIHFGTLTEIRTTQTKNEETVAYFVELREGDTARSIAVNGEHNLLDLTDGQYSIRAGLEEMLEHSTSCCAARDAYTEAEDVAKFRRATGEIRPPVNTTDHVADVTDPVRDARNSEEPL